MRREIEKILIKKMEEDDSLYVLFADLGCFRSLQEVFPQRCLNCGVAEINMINVAAGLLLGGKRVVVYSISGFIINRAYEQLKNNIAQEDLPLIILNGGGGLSYNEVGGGHYLTDDMSVCRQFDMEFFSPFNMKEFNENFNIETKKMTYFRLQLDNNKNFDSPLFRTKNPQVVVYTTNTLVDIVSESLDETFQIKNIDSIEGDSPACYIMDNTLVGSFAEEKRKEEDLVISLPLRFKERAETRRELLKKAGLSSLQIKQKVTEWKSSLAL